MRHLQHTRVHRLFSAANAGSRPTHHVLHLTAPRMLAAAHTSAPHCLTWMDYRACAQCLFCFPQMPGPRAPALCTSCCFPEAKAQPTRKRTRPHWQAQALGHLAMEARPAECCTRPHWHAQASGHQTIHGGQACRMLYPPTLACTGTWPPTHSWRQGLPNASPTHLHTRRVHGLLHAMLRVRMRNPIRMQPHPPTCTLSACMAC